MGHWGYSDDAVGSVVWVPTTSIVRYIYLAGTIACMGNVDGALPLGSREPLDHA